MLITKREQSQKMQMSPQLRSLIDDLTNCPIKRLPSKLQKLNVWEKPRGDLFQWVPVLNRFDEIFEEKVKEYNLSGEEHKLQEISNDDLTLLSACLDYTGLLLENCSNRSIYSSVHRLYELLNSSSVPLRLSLLKVLVITSERYTQTGSNKFSAPSSVKKKVLRLASYFPLPVPSSFGNEHFTLLDTLNVEKKYPSKWKHIDFEYYKSTLTPSAHRTTTDSPNATPTKPKKNKETSQPTQESQSSAPSDSQMSISGKKKNKNKKKAKVELVADEGIHHFSMSEENVRKLSLQQIYDRACESIPKESWFEFGLTAPVAKAFNNKSFESLKLREQLVQIKCLSIAFTACIGSTANASSRLFESEPYIFSFLVDLIDLENAVSKDVYYSAMKTLESIALRRVWGADIVRTMSGNVTHGMLFQSLRIILKQVKDPNNKAIPYKSYTQFFQMLSNLIESKSLVSVLTSAGLLTHLMEFLKLRSNHRAIFSVAVHLVNSLLGTSPDSTDAFITNNGFNLLIEAIGYEVDFCINNPDYGGGPPKEAIVYYTISYRQADYLKNLLKFTLNLIQSDPSDRMRNLFDSPLLGSLSKILERPATFGPNLITHSIDIVSAIIHNQPTAFPILNESKIIDTILNNFESLFGPSYDLLLSMPEVLGAICLNTEGLKKIQDTKAIEKLFKIFENIEYAKVLVRSHVSNNFGTSIDELGRHYPVLKPEITRNVCNLIRNVPIIANRHLRGTLFYSSPKGSLYQASTEEVLENEEGSQSIECWEDGEGAYLIDNLGFFLAGLIQESGSWKNMMDSIKFTEWLPLFKIENAPFDYTYAPSFISFTNVLKYFENQDKEYGLNYILDEFYAQMEGLQSFVNFTDYENSFFSQFTEDTETPTTVLRNLNSICSLLHLFTSVYIISVSGHGSRLIQIAKLFGTPKGVEIVKFFSLLFKRCAIEEAILRCNMPSVVAKETCPSRGGSDYSPIQVYTAEPSDDPQNEGKTSAKFKNALQIRCLVHKVQCNIGACFTSFGRLLMSKKQELGSNDFRKSSVRITQEVAIGLIDLLDLKAKDQLVSSGYLLVVTNLISVLLTGRLRTEYVQTSLAICILQYGGFRRLKEIAVSNWKLLQSLDLDKVNKTNEFKFLGNTIESITKNVIGQATLIFTKIVNEEKVIPVPYSGLLFSNNVYGASILSSQNDLTASFIIQTRLLGFHLIRDLLDPDVGTLSNDEGVKRIPTPLIDQLITIAKHVFLEKGEEDSRGSGMLYPLEWQNARPAESKLAYLESLGVSSKDAADILKHDDLNILKSNSYPNNPHFELDREEWPKIVDRAKSNPYVAPELSPVEPQVEQSNTLEDLDFMRKSQEDSFIDQWLLVAQLFPKSVVGISDLLIQVFSHLSEPDAAVVSVLEYLFSFDFESEEQIPKIASMLHLYGLLMQNDSIFNSSNSSVEGFLTFFMEGIKPEYVNRDWFCYGLLVLERILASSDIPNQDDFKVATDVHMSKLQIPFVIPQEVLDKLLSSILLINSITNVKTALSLARILTIYAKDPQTASGIARSPVLSTLIKSVSAFISSDKNVPFQSSILILARRCFENVDVIKANMSLDFPEYFRNSRKGLKDLFTMTKESASTVLRAPEVFVEVISKEVKLENCEEPLQQLSVSHIPKEEQPKEDVDMVDASTGERIDMPDPKSDLCEQTGIMHILLSELMSLSKKNWLTDPSDSMTTNDFKDSKDKKKAIILKNPLCAYACFILQLMIELLSSYKQSKLEFLTFSKKQLFEGPSKPRSTALNFFIHQLIPTNLLNVSQGPEFERRCVVSTLARLVILAFVSTPVNQQGTKPDPKKEDLDSLFIRKFTVDSLLKFLKETSMSTEVATIRYSKTVDLCELVSALLSHKYRDMLGNCLNGYFTNYDNYYLGKVMLDKGLPSHITSILAELDLNFPEAKRVVKLCIKPLNSLGAIKSEYQDLFKESQNGEADEEEVVSDDYDFREETPDLFRNSTLGMYDVDDIDSEEDEMDYFDEDGPIDVVYSEDDGSDEEDSEDGLDSGDESDLSLVGDELDDISHAHNDDDDQMSDEFSTDEEDDEHHHHHHHIPGHILDHFRNEEEDVDNSDHMHDDISAEDEELEGASEDYESFSIDEEDEEFSVSDEGAFDEWVDAFENSDEPNGQNPHAEENESNESDTPSIMEFDEDNDEGDDDDDDDNDSVIDENAGYDFMLGINENGRRSNNNQYEIRSRGRTNIDLSENRLLEVLGRGHSGGSFGNLVDHLLNSANADTSTLYGSLRIGNRDVDIPMRQLERLLGSGAKKDSSLIHNMDIRSTKERWIEAARMFHEKDATRAAMRVVPAIVNSIYDSSLEIFNKKKDDEKKRREQEKEELVKKLEEAHRARMEDENEETKPDPITDDASNTSHIPIFVRIGEEEVDIGGTDIDPEFFEALPDDMREEVFTQHIRERRAVGNSSGYDTREIDPDFLEALPEPIREEILQQEALSNHTNALENEIRERRLDAIPPEGISGNVVAASTDAKKSSKNKIYFTPLVDRFGVSALTRLIFIPQSYNQRETLHNLLEYLCFNKQTRSEVMGLLISILQDGILSQRSLEKSFSQISSRAKILQNAYVKGTTPKTPLTPLEIKQSSVNQFPSGSSPLVVANQSVEALQYLLEADPHMRYYFLTEHENPFILKKLKRNNQIKMKDAITKFTKYPINYLLDLLDKKLVCEEPGLMDILSRTLQVATRPLNTFKKNKEKAAEEEMTIQSEIINELPSISAEGEDENKKKDEKIDSKDKGKHFEPPFIPDSNLRKIVTILVANECSSKTFQQALSAMQNLSVIDNAQKVFPVELSDHATKLGHSLIVDLNNLVTEIKNTGTTELTGKAFGKFTPASSDQAKLLRVLTALDYLFDSKQETSETVDEVEALTNLYKKLALGSLWDALSDCLRVLEERTELSHVATALLPLIEALMVVCKHSKVKELQFRDALKYESRKIDFAKEPIESLFFSFTDEHKKILNQMVRSNPKLMSGPFSMLVRNPRVLEFDNKKNFFDRKLHSHNEERSTMNVSVRRDQVFLDSYRALFFKPSEDFRKAKLDISFKGEAGVDAGGVTREWFQVLSRQMFNADYALFTPVASDKTTFHPNRTSYANPEHLSFFKFIGRIIGKAIYDNCFLDCHFSRAVYKRLLSRPVSLKDMENLDLDYFKSLMWMLENDITDIITETFSVESDDFGEHKIIDLIPNGRDITVSEMNKQDYVRLVVEYRLQTSVQEQMNNFLIGFHEIIPKDLIAIFDEQELELLVSGLPDIDVDDWKNNTTYNNYSPSSPQIQWFWRAVRSFDVEERAKLLQFATGTSKVPLNGFKELGGVNGVSKFSIHRDYGSTERLPSSHTCFNQIDLPEYDSYETLRGSLLLSITEGHEGFGLA